MVNKFPTKMEVVQTLLTEDPSIKKYNRLILLLEFKKISSVLGIVKAELVSNGKVTLKGSYTCQPIFTEESTFNWDLLKNNESYSQGFSLDIKAESVGSKIKMGFETAIKNGNIPFLPR